MTEALQEEGASAKVLEMWQLARGWRLPPRDRARIARAAVDAFEQLGEWDAACVTFEEAQRLEASADVDWSKVSGTPAFAIDGTVLEDVHTWDGLSAALSGKAPAAQEQ